MLDIKLIEAGKYESKIQTFNPMKTLQFIQDMFTPQASMQESTISYRTVSVGTLELAVAHNHLDSLMHIQAIPD